jgi:serine/threonine-protein kinase
MEPKRERIGEYELLMELGQGGIGRVHLAKRLHSDELVALKVAKAPHARGAGHDALFAREIEAQSELLHPHIARVQASGTDRGRLFLVMQFLGGGALTDAMNWPRFREPRRAIALMVTLARAVDFAHRRRVLHGALRASNVLFDEHGQPFITDFGIARLMAGAAPEGEPNGFGATPGWSAPEQLAGRPSSTAVDVFSLGVLLHWLRTGELLFGDGEDFAERVSRASRAAPPAWTPRIGAALDAIEWRATRFDPESRYASAGEFAEDLERVLADAPLSAAPTPALARVWLWTRRHRLAWYGALCLLAGSAGSAFTVEHRERLRLRQLILEVNTYAASGQATALFHRLRGHVKAVHRAAEDPRVRKLASAPRESSESAASSDGKGERPCPAGANLLDPSPLLQHAGRFSTLMVLNEEGCPIARWTQDPVPPDEAAWQREWRDHFADVKRAWQSGDDEPLLSSPSGPEARAFKVAISTSLVEEGRWLGVISGVLSTATALELPLPTGAIRQGADQLAALLGEYEGSDSSDDANLSPAEPSYAYVSHPGLPRDRVPVVPPEYVEAFKKRFFSSPNRARLEPNAALPFVRDDYVDPFLGERWLAAFAPVGNTGYVVLVQTRDRTATQPTVAFGYVARGLALVSVVGVGAAALFFAWDFLRRRSEGAPRP